MPLLESRSMLWQEILSLCIILVSCCTHKMDVSLVTHDAPFLRETPIIIITQAMEVAFAMTMVTRMMAMMKHWFQWIFKEMDKFAMTTFSKPWSDP